VNVRRELAIRFSDGWIKCGNQPTDISVPTVELIVCLRAEEFSINMGCLTGLVISIQKTLTEIYVNNERIKHDDRKTIIKDNLRNTFKYT